MSWLKIDRVLSRLQTASDCNEKSSTCRPSCQPQNTKILNSECERNVYNTGISTLVVPSTCSDRPRPVISNKTFLSDGLTRTIYRLRRSSETLCNTDLK